MSFHGYMLNTPEPPCAFGISKSLSYSCSVELIMLGHTPMFDLNLAVRQMTLPGSMVLGPQSNSRAWHRLHPLWPTGQTPKLTEVSCRRWVVLLRLVLVKQRDVLKGM